MKFTKALNFIFVKITFKYLSVGQFDPPSSLFCVLREHAFIVLPVVLKIVKIGIIEGPAHYHRVIIIHFTKSIELILRPHTFICHFTTLIVQFSKTIHFIVLPIAFIIPTVLVVKSSLAISHSSALKTLILATSFILFHNVLLISEVLGFIGVFGCVLIFDFDYC